MRSSMTRDCQPRGCQRRGYQPRGYQRRVLLLGARTWACLLVLGTVMVGVPAGAQAADAPPKKTAQPQADAPQAEAPRVEPTADELSRARDAFIDGRRLMENSRWLPAAEKFQEALAVKQTPGLYYYLGFCLENGGNAAESLAAYESGRALLEVETAKDVETLLPEAIARVEASMGAVDVRGVEEGLTVSVDGAAEARVTATALRLPGGTHQLLFSAPGYTPRQVTIEVIPGESTVALSELTPETLGPVASPSSPDDSSSSSLRTGVFWGSVGVFTGGVAASVVGGILFAQAEADIVTAGEEVDSATGSSGSGCAATSSRPAACDDLDAGLDARSSATTLLIVGGAAAGVGLAGALLTHFLWPETDAALSGQVSAEGFALSVSGRF